MKKLVFFSVALFAVTLLAESAAPTSWNGTQARELKVSADRMAADNVTGNLVASGHVRAVCRPVSLLSDLVERQGDEYRFHDPTLVTTCTNCPDCLHWSATGEVAYRDRHSVMARDVVIRVFGIPVLWLPYWYYPLDTDYGLRMMPGYTSRWGAYLMTKYVYRIAGDFAPGAYGLDGASRLDLRSENGIAFGQSLRWQLGDRGRGAFKVYYAADNDHDRYDRHWNDAHKWNYSNWGSTVDRDRYAFMLEHRWDVTERDVVRLRGAIYSDSHFRRDFLRDGTLALANEFLDDNANELAWEHFENGWGMGVSVTGPLEDFRGGVARLPEVYFDLAPQPVFALPVNYEAQTKAGFLNRDYARYGDSRTREPFRHSPGVWADYQCFRFDSYHRFSLPFRVADVLSVVPRVGLRGTWWSDTGNECLDGRSRAGSADDDCFRSIVEGGVTFAARGTARLSDGWTHVVEPYADFLAQEAKYSGLGRGHRPYVFDSADMSRDWLDQFAGRSRNLPYSWYGITPGVRNAFRADDEKGVSRTVLDLDFYAAVQFNDSEWTEGSRFHRLAKSPADPNYGRRSVRAMPGFRARCTPSDDTMFGARMEYDTESDVLAYADLSWSQVVSRHVKFDVVYSARNQRWWDYSSAPYDPEAVKNEDFNRAYYSFLQVEVEHEICDALAWGPFVRWDFRESELAEVGGWLDIRTDCLGFRFSVAYESEYERVDRSDSDEDWRFGFSVYLRAVGPSNGRMF